MTITPEQCRAARVLLKWSQSDLAKAASVGLATVTRFERGASTPYSTTLKTLRAALEAAGIVLIDDNGTIGVVLRPRGSGKE